MALLTQFSKHFLLKYELTSFNCLLSPFVLCSFILFDIGKTDFSVLVLLRSEAVSLLEIKWIMPEVFPHNAVLVSTFNCRSNYFLLISITEIYFVSMACRLVLNLDTATLQ